ncbi:MAG TPA: UbiD family decarboxylase [Chitinophagaceae bacterium]|nr:UbiD family decarboxylase [Chitinophagaceae bacterium]
MYKSLGECIEDLQSKGQVVSIKEEVDPNLVMAALHLRIHEQGGPALLFENVKGSKFKAVSNMFGTMKRSKYMFRHTLKKVEEVVKLRKDPTAAIKKPFSNIKTGLAAWKALPKRGTLKDFIEVDIEDLPMIKHWPMDGGAFMTLPQVYTEDMANPGIMNSNLGMYRIQMNGNEYELNKEVGLHYQIHRGIGVHQTIANNMGKPLPVSIFIGGHPAHTLSSVMPLPEGMAEVTFAGLLAGRRFQYAYDDNGHCISLDADFVITGWVYPDDNKPEGPFGDHLGYYSLTHPFPVMKVAKVYAKPDGIWPFTVVGRPPQEDTAFGKLIHEMTGEAIKQDLPGVEQVHAVDAAGVHPLLFAIGTERYTPYAEIDRPAEILTQSHKILGTGQLSLAKYLFITATKNKEKLDINDERAYLKYVLERIHWDKDVHFMTNTTIDTLDYTGTALNAGSKVTFAAYGDPIRQLCENIPEEMKRLEVFHNVQLAMEGVLIMEGPAFKSYQQAQLEMDMLSDLVMARVSESTQKSIALIVIVDDSKMVSESLRNFLWATFTKSNPSHDIYGVNSFIEFKHWGCYGPLIIDARRKPHHAPDLILDEEVEKEVDAIIRRTPGLEKYI